MLPMLQLLHILDPGSQDPCVQDCCGVVVRWDVSAEHCDEPLNVMEGLLVSGGGQSHQPHQSADISQHNIAPYTQHNLQIKITDTTTQH